MTTAKRRYDKSGHLRFGILLALAALVATAPRAAQTPSGAQALQAACGACHRPDGPGRLARISAVRKTPEGWVMTIFRMQHVHGLKLSDAQRDALVRYLADTQGLAPSEAKPARFALERRPNVPDLELPGNLQTMCARCHSAARIALQRRDAGEWLKNVNWHLAQWPTIEYQQNARDRHWWRTASTVVPAELGKLFPLHTESWRIWQHHKAVDLGGRWLVHGHRPGRGDYWGTADITRGGDGDYRAAYRLTDEHGTATDGASHAIVYTGYEWRGTAKLGTLDTHEVFAASADGSTLSGRWFIADHPEIGADWTAVRAATQPQIVAVSPDSIRIGSRARIVVFGSHLGGKISFGPGTHARLIARSADRLEIEVAVDSAAHPGYRTVRVGRASDARSIALYDRVDRLEVTPAYAIARLGGGRIDPVSAQFDAVAYEDIAAADGKTRALRLGSLPVAWSVAPFNEEAVRDRDVDFAGHIDAFGQFMPAGAGPNPQRKFSADNTGNLFVVATLKAEAHPAASAKPVVGKAHLIVTVQRWNTPPIY